MIGCRSADTNKTCMYLCKHVHLTVYFPKAYVHMLVSGMEEAITWTLKVLFTSANTCALLNNRNEISC